MALGGFLLLIYCIIVCIICKVYAHCKFNVMQDGNRLTIIDAMETNSGLYSCQHISTDDAVVVTDIQINITCEFVCIFIISESMNMYEVYCVSL